MLEATSITAAPAAVSLFSNCGAGDIGFGAAGFRFRVMAELVEGRLDTDMADYEVPRRRKRAFLTFVRRASSAADLLLMDPGRYFDGFERKMGWPLGRSPESIAESLGAISYAEAEDFCHDIRRRLALSPGESSVKAVVTEQLRLWQARARRRDSA